MTATVARFDPVFAAQATFRTVLDAMARPGTTAPLPARDPGCPVAGCDGVAAVLLTLLDHEVTFAAVPAPGRGADGERLTAYLAGATGGRSVAVEAADYVLVLGGPLAGLPGSLRRGTPAFPDEGATLVATVASLGGVEEGLAVALAGPGVAPGTTLRVGGWRADDLTAVAAANAEPPLGIDLILAAPDGSVACLPRSTRLTLVGD